MSNELKAIVVVMKRAQRDALKRPLVALQEVRQQLQSDPLDPPAASQIDLTGKSQTTKCTGGDSKEMRTWHTVLQSQSGADPHRKPLTASGTEWKTGQNRTRHPVLSRTKTHYTDVKDVNNTRG